MRLIDGRKIRKKYPRFDSLSRVHDELASDIEPCKLVSASLGSIVIPDLIGNLFP